MNEEKPWYLSRTIWASVVTILSSLLLVLGHTITPDLQSYLTDVILMLVTGISGAVGAYYRVTATSKLK